MLGELPRPEARTDERGPTSAQTPREVDLIEGVAGWDTIEGVAGWDTPAEQPGVMLAQSIERWTLQDILAGLRRWRRRIGLGAPAA